MTADDRSYPPVGGGDLPQVTAVGGVLLGLAAGYCLGRSGPGGVTHTARVAVVRNEALCGWWCPVCRGRPVVTDEMLARAGVPV